MSIYVLIHGACFGGWCWDKVKGLLEAEGHSVIAPDLPGHGQDSTPVSEVTLEAYIRRVSGILDSQAKPVILVGHSLGGAVITQVAEYRPEKIESLVYLAAFLPRNGQSLSESAAGNTGSLLEVDYNPQQGFVTFKEECLIPALFADCSKTDINRARALLRPQATAPQVTPVHTSDENFGRVPRIYIELLEDKAVLPAFQKLVYTSWPFKKVIRLKTGHSPFFSAPEALKDCLLACAMETNPVFS